MAPTQRLVAGRSRMTPAAHAYWARDRRHDLPRQLRVAAKPPTSDRIDRGTGRSSSATHHRSRRSVPDTLSVRGERIRVASVAFPCLAEKCHEPGTLVCDRAPILSTNNAGRLHSHAARSELVVGIATMGWQRRGRAAIMRNDNCGTANYHSRDSVVHVVDGPGIANHLCGSACGKGGGRERS